MEHYLGILELQREVGVELATQILRRKWGGGFSGQGKGNRTRARQKVYTEVNLMNDGQKDRNRVTALSKLEVRKWKSDLPATYCLLPS